MNLRLTETEAVAIRALLEHRAHDIRTKPGASTIAVDLAEQYDRLATFIAERPVRKGQVSLTLTKADGSRLEHLIAHDKGAAVRSALYKILDARRPKVDPRRPGGRRVREEVAS